MSPTIDQGSRSVGKYSYSEWKAHDSTVVEKSVRSKYYLLAIQRREKQLRGRRGNRFRPGMTKPLDRLFRHLEDRVGGGVWGTGSQTGSDRDFLWATESSVAPAPLDATRGF